MTNEYFIDKTRQRQKNNRKLTKYKIEVKELLKTGEMEGFWKKIESNNNNKKRICY